MRRPPRCRAVLFALAALSVGAGARAADDVVSASAPLMYGLTGDPVAEQLLLATRWGQPSLALRLDTSAGLGAHEVRFLSAGTPMNWAPPYAGPDGTEAMTDVNIDVVRATYRYTLLSAPKWAMKLGLSANVGEPAGALQPTLGGERSSFGSLPLVHLAGVGQWSPRWRLAFALDGLATTRGRALDLGLQVDYVWSPSMSLFGGYQLTDAAGEAENYYGNTLSNRANIGLRYRF